MLKAPGRATRKEKEIKGIQIGEEVKLPLFADYMIPYIRDPQNYRTTSRNDRFSNVAGYRMENTSSFHNLVLGNCPHTEKRKQDPHLSPFMKTNTKGTKDLKVRPVKLKLVYKKT